MNGPFYEPPFKNVHISPLGLCPKKEPSKYRMVQHLLYPKGHSVNDFIPLEFSEVHYTQIHDAISGIKTFSSPCYLAKCDIEKAYRNLPLAPTAYHLFGFKWNNLFYYDKCLPMGCSSSCQIFEQFSTAIQWIGKNDMPSGLIFHILDDFLIIAQTKEDCKYYLEQFLEICGKIGIPMAPNKTVGPEKVLTF